MENYLIYMGKVSISAGVFYLAFLLLFQNSKQFVFNRFYLPGSLALSFIIPLITFTTVNYIQPVKQVDLSSLTYLPEVTQINAEPDFTFQWYHYLFAIYIIALAGFVIHLGLGHLKAIAIVRKSAIKTLFQVKVNITGKDVHPFSFFNKIVISEKTLDNPNLEIIVKHEHIHVKEKHTIDILFSEILFLFQWFNPFAWLLKDAMKNNLEYKTDHQIVANYNPLAYQLAMVGLADKKGVAPFLTALNGSQLKNRIMMMKKKTEKKYTFLKQLLVLPLMAILVMGLSNKEIQTEIIQNEKYFELVVDGKRIDENHPVLKSMNDTKKFDSKEIADKLDLSERVISNHLVMDEDTQNATLYILTKDYEKGTYPEFEKHVLTHEKSIEQQESPKTLFAIDGNILDENEFEKIEKAGFESAVVLSGKNAREKYGELAADAAVIDFKSGVSRVKVYTDTSIKEEIVKGKVTDKKGEPLSGASVIIKGKTIGTITDAEGNYEIKTDNENETLVFIVPGYEKVEIPVKGMDKIDIQLKPGKMVMVNTRSTETFSRQKKYKYIIGGRVSDKNDSPVSGAAVLIKGKTIGTITNTEGYYEIGCEEKIETLVFSMYGFKKQEVEVNNKKKIDIKLDVDETQKSAGVEIKVNNYRNTKADIEKFGGPIFFKVEEMPQFPGGESALKKWISNNINYPEIAAENGIQGKVYVSFVVDKKGDVRDPQISRGVDPSLDKEAVRVVSNLPLWKPGKQNGNIVNVSYTVPVNFVLTNELKRKYNKLGLDGYPRKNNKNSEKVQEVGYGANNQNNGADPNGFKVRLKGDSANSPIYVVNGVEFADISHINPEDIESIEVIKDKAALDLYGEKGKNGVVCIQTKQPVINDKLIIVDGKEYDGEINDISPNEIASISVLKDKSATSVYGSKGKNGVVIIETKQVENKDPLYFLDGKRIGVNEANNKMRNRQLIKEVVNLSEAEARLKYGNAGKNGVVEIYSKKNPTTVDLLFSSDSEKEKPLVLVDGKKFHDIGQIDPVYIKSVNVLKDVAATEQYGDLGKNGVIEVTLKKPEELSQNEIPVVLNGKTTGKKLNEIDRDLIEKIKKLKPNEATKKYGDFGKYGVLEIQSRNVFTENVKVKSSNESEDLIMDTELKLRKFIAKEIRYPKEAVEANIEKEVYVAVKIDKQGKIKSISENGTKLEIHKRTDFTLDEVVVIAYRNKENSKVGYPTKKAADLARQLNEELIVGEARRVIHLAHEININRFKGKTIGVGIKFVLQD